MSCRSSIFRTETRTAERFVGLPSLEKAKLWPTVDEILADARATHDQISDQLVLGALKSVLIEYIVAGRFEAVHAAVGKVLGVNFPAGKSLPDQEVEPRKPLAKASR